MLVTSHGLGAKQSDIHTNQPRERRPAKKSAVCPDANTLIPILPGGPHFP